METVINTFLAVFGISILVIAHESGHYLVARMFGMKVLRYSIGIGPTLFKYKPKDSPTTFQVCAIPFLAYVQIAGMNPFEDIDRNDPSLYPNKSLFARAMTIAAGPFANYLVAVLLVFGMAIVGWPRVTVGEVTAGSPAEMAGVKTGDIVSTANGEQVLLFPDLIAATSPRAGQATTYEFIRDGEPLVLEIVPQDMDGRGIIGVRMGEPMLAPLPLAAAGKAAMQVPLAAIMMQVQGIISQFERRTTEDIGSVVRMGKMLTEQAERGWFDYLLMLVILSMALGFFNMLPFPALDGGRLVFLGYELITRRRPNERFEAMVHTVGILFLLGVFVLVTWRDIFGEDPRDRKQPEAVQQKNGAPANPDGATKDNTGGTPSNPSTDGANDSTEDGAKQE